MSTITWTLDFGILGEHDVVVEYDYSPGAPGRTYGPPEDCYPDEPPEVDFLKVDGTPLWLNSDGVEYLLGALEDDIALLDRIMEKEASDLHDFRAAKAEYEAERYADERVYMNTDAWDCREK
jgi:hypothetical protein